MDDNTNTPLNSDTPVTPPAPADDSATPFYSDDLNAAALADTNTDPDAVGFTPTAEEPVTSNDMSMGDLDATQPPVGDSMDEEADPAAGDNTVDTDSIEGSDPAIS